MNNPGETLGKVGMLTPNPLPSFEVQQDGYGAFNYSVKKKDIIINDIKNQKEHHYDEFKRLLVENEIEFDEKYLLQILFNSCRG